MPKDSFRVLLKPYQFRSLQGMFFVYQLMVHAEQDSLALFRGVSDAVWIACGSHLLRFALVTACSPLQTSFQLHNQGALAWL